MQVNFKNISPQKEENEGRKRGEEEITQSDHLQRDDVELDGGQREVGQNCAEDYRHQPAGHDHQDDGAQRLEDLACEIVFLFYKNRLTDFLILNPTLILILI